MPEWAALERDRPGGPLIEFVNKRDEFLARPHYVVEGDYSSDDPFYEDPPGKLLWPPYEKIEDCSQDPDIGAHDWLMQDRLQDSKCRRCGVRLIVRAQ